MKIISVSCVGAGMIGSGWATLLASKGLKVIIQDLTQERIARALKNINDNLDFLEQNGLLNKGEARKVFRNVKATTNLADAVKDVDYIQESILEDYEAKKRIFREMDGVARQATILASSASGLLMTEIQKATAKPGRCILAHPYMPVHLIPLVEIVPGEKTSKETVEATYQFMSEIGKIPIILKKEVPGYIANRFNAALWREAIDLVDKGVATVEDIDKAFLAGLGSRFAIMGPHLRAHLAGGSGGIENFIKTLGQSYSNRWKDMATWTSIPHPAAEKVIQGVKEMEIIRTKNYKEICRWRDQKLVKLNKLLFREKLS